MASLGSRERVLRAIAHQETDRLPRDLSVDPALHEELCAAAGAADMEALKALWRIDVETVGMTYRNPYSDGTSLFGHTLAGATTVAQVEAHDWPDPGWADYDSFRSAVEKARATGRAVVASSWGSIFGESYRLMGMDNFMVAVALYPEVVQAIVRHLTDFFRQVDRRAFTACRDLIDISYHGNDFGSQRGLFFSRRAFQGLYAGPIAELTGQAHRFGLRTMFHSCGAVGEIIPDLVAAGVDVLDPVQFTAVGMDPRGLKARFGQQLTFHGCISAQRVLPLGTPVEVRAHVREVCETMRPGGGYIFVSDQMITRDTPVQNIVAMYAAIDEAGY
jgi:uroporphyrinogen decarboxylase